MSHKGELDRVLLDFAAGRLDMLVGTQMIAKGHDFPRVTLVGVISVDIGLGLPDLRSAERTFQLITQVAGRSGRGETAGRVLIQTYYPEHYALRHAVNQDYEGFYGDEIKFRERLAYPPFLVLASIMVKHRDQANAARTANILRRSSTPQIRPGISASSAPHRPRSHALKNEYRIQLNPQGPDPPLLPRNSRRRPRRRRIARLRNTHRLCRDRPGQFDVTGRTTKLHEKERKLHLRSTRSCSFGIFRG